ncbi:D-glucuronyl C5-epimerase family protein [Clostridium cadaveris]|uniref:D-glucuronyl C5-epimerase family protein n=1 Tax=Clostridium cadaveris TaxID=1529 RepID=UPI000420C59F|nr:D-glucuronyl C5-epimerase family protein [Clostridium cadaveris]
MLLGKSSLHVNQDIGRIYSIKDVKGYYNDLTEKIAAEKEYNKDKLPLLKTKTGEKILFPISIFQYGLGAYDLFLIKKEKLFLEKFKICVDWAYDNQEDSGAWSNFFYVQPDCPYSSMAQGEGISLLIRAYKEFNDDKYLNAAQNAVEFLIMPISDGGTAMYRDDEIFLHEFTNKPVVLNGWIFSLFGLYDYLKVVDDSNVKLIYYKSIKTMINHLNDFDNGYWSKYNIENMITSQFYHKLHIAQLKVMYEITREIQFKEYADKWIRYEEKWLNRKKSFITKVWQKLKEK